MIDMCKQTPFGRLADGRPAQLFTLDNGVLALSVTDYGATAVRLTVPTPDGTPVNVLLGYGGAAEYERDDKYLGATVGRCANRIGGAAFTLGGRRYTLSANDGENHLHGGKSGFNDKLWTVISATDTAVTFTLAGYTVCGFDINPAVVERLNNGQIHIVEPGLQEAMTQAMATGRLHFTTTPEPADVFIICVQTPHRDTPEGKRVSDMRFVESAARSVGGVLRVGNLCVLESTSPPYSTRLVESIVSEVSGLAPEEFMTAHCPERIIPGRMLIELRENDRIVGATRPESAEYAKEIYSPVVTKGTIRVTDDLTAEMCKLVENTFRDINIAYANELSKVCDRLGIDVFSLIQLANCHPRVNVHTPGVGVGGHCIAVDPWFIHEKFEDITPLIYQARLVNDSKPAWVADRIERDIAPGSTVAVLGMSFKANIDDIRESPSVELAKILTQRGYQVLACEPFVQGDVAGFENHSLEEALAACDYAVVTLAHDPFKAAKDKIAAKPHFDCVGLLR